MTEQDFDHIDYRKALLHLPKDIQWLVCHLDEQAQDYPDFKNITFTRLLLTSPDCYFQVYRIPKDLATQPVGNLFGGVTVYQTRPADNVEEIFGEIIQTLTDISNHQPKFHQEESEESGELKACMLIAEEQMGRTSYWQLEHHLVKHAVEWMFQNYEIGRKIPKADTND